MAKSRITYVILGFLLGGLGIHNFYAGYTGRGLAQLLIMLFTCWLIVPIFMIWLWVIIELVMVTEDGNGMKFE